MPDRSDVIIYHNPACGTSRKVLGLLNEAGLQPRIIEYLRHPPDAAELRSLLHRMGKTARDILRRKGTPFDELGLGDPDRSEAELIQAIVAHPILLERPVVATPWGVALCRPAETVTQLIAAKPAAR